MRTGRTFTMYWRTLSAAWFGGTEASEKLFKHWAVADLIFSMIPKMIVSVTTHPAKKLLKKHNARFVTVSLGQLGSYTQKQVANLQSR